MSTNRYASAFTTDDLRAALEEFRRQLVATGKAEDTIHTYTDRAERFINWLDGSYVP